MKIFSDPTYLNWLMIIGTLAAFIAFSLTGLATYFSSQNQLHEQKETSSLQRKLLEKSEENALLNSQISNLQELLRKRVESHLESQNLIGDEIVTIKHLWSIIENRQLKQNEYISNIQNSINGIIDFLMIQGSLNGEAESILKQAIKREFQAEDANIFLKGSTASLEQTSETIRVENQKIVHFFDGRLSIFVSIEPNEHNELPITTISLLSPGGNTIKHEITEIKTCISYDSFAIRPLSITLEAAEFNVSVNSPCNE